MLVFVIEIKFFVLMFFFLSIWLNFLILVFLNFEVLWMIIFVGMCISVLLYFDNVEFNKL